MALSRSPVASKKGLSRRAFQFGFGNVDTLCRGVAK
jgi:hypothetical protein